MIVTAMNPAVSRTYRSYVYKIPSPIVISTTNLDCVIDTPTTVACYNYLDTGGVQTIRLIPNTTACPSKTFFCFQL